MEVWVALHCFVKRIFKRVVNWTELVMDVRK